MQLGFLTDYVTAVEDNVEVLDFILLLLNYFDIFFRDMLSLNAKESQRFELFEIWRLVLKDFSEVGPVVLKILGVEKEVTCSILVLEL